MSDSAAARRLRLALDMYEFGVQMQRARLRRLNPAASEADIDVAVQKWLLTRPGAAEGDGVGKPSHRFA
jgi:Rv0078B-related antitoxin